MILWTHFDIIYIESWGDVMVYLIIFKQINLDQLCNLFNLGFDIKFNYCNKYITIYVSEQKEKEFINSLD